MLLSAYLPADGAAVVRATVQRRASSLPLLIASLASYSSPMLVCLILSPKCNDSGCSRAQHPHLQTEYRFAPGVFWSQIIRLQASYQATEAVTFAMNGNTEGLNSLFVRGLASPADVSDTRGYSLLRWALYSNQYQTCQFLVHAGADPDYRYNFPRIHEIVIGLRFGDLTEDLKQNPDTVNAQDAMGRTPLLWAAARVDEKAVATLLAFGADPNIVDIQWSGPVAFLGYKIGSPLNCAARNASDPPLIKTLLDFNAKVDACGVDGRTALIHAARTNNFEFALMLLEHYANINWKSSSGPTPLTTAVMYNSHAVLKLLLGRWWEYNNSPRLKGPRLLQAVAQYADLETILILSGTDHFRLKYDMQYQTCDFEKVLHDRHDADEKLIRAFADFLSVIGEQVPEES
ncbi:ankyrin repeat-containing domain protein [Nemania sp. NC0429]|nr:ankyrin repeat-containing domain protein [Nemania sp. NC0429]